MRTSYEIGAFVPTSAALPHDPLDKLPPEMLLSASISSALRARRDPLVDVAGKVNCALLLLVSTIFSVYSRFAGVFSFGTGT